MPSSSVALPFVRSRRDVPVAVAYDVGDAVDLPVSGDDRDPTVLQRDARVRPGPVESPKRSSATTWHIRLNSYSRETGSKMSFGTARRFVWL